MGALTVMLLHQPGSIHPMFLHQRAGIYPMFLSWAGRTCTKPFHLGQRKCSSSAAMLHHVLHILRDLLSGTVGVVLRFSVAVHAAMLVGERLSNLV